MAAACQASGAFTAPVVDADADAPRPWMPTLYIPGEGLGATSAATAPCRCRSCANSPPASPRPRVTSHRAGMVHRYLKPAKVMLAEDGSRATEFGASDVLTQTGRDGAGHTALLVPGTVLLAVGRGPGRGRLLPRLGRRLHRHRPRPLRQPGPYETALRVVDGIPELDDVPPDLLPFIHFRLEKHPKSRPTPDELLGLLRDGRMPEPRGPEPTPADEETSPARPPRRRRRLWSAIVLGTALLTAVTAVTAATVAVTGDDSAPADLPRTAGRPGTGSRRTRASTRSRSVPRRRRENTDPLHDPLPGPQDRQGDLEPLDRAGQGEQDTVGQADGRLILPPRAARTTR
ncbi:hypothetical protein [Streptomyces sp. NPDC057301]|uniref:hypothetical protein n=1 Tax=Streptomyces sp. NPDC057301 TaxID=3346093 RepID=UPI00363FE0C0